MDNCKQPLRTYLNAIICLATAATLSCTHDTENLSLGLIEEHAGYVPARIAVMPCLTYPEGAGYESLILSNTSTDAKAEICSKLDTFVIDGFKDQPYMRGFSPQAVRKLVEGSGDPSLIDELTKHWAHASDNCRECKNPQSYYATTIAARTGWRDWLIRLSKAVRNADAILLPFLVTSYEKTYIDRGVRVMQRGANVTLLLIDTNSGHLLWSGGRGAFSNHQAIRNTDPEKDLSYPPWEQVYERLLTEDIWRDFPGRQVYR